MMLTEMLNFLQTRVPFVPTSKKDLEDFVRHVGITEADIVYDLGSGNGKVVFAIAKLTGASSTGLQRWGWTQTYAKIKKYLAGIGLGDQAVATKTRFIDGNFFNSSWTEATVIYAYLYPFLMPQVASKALKDCRPGTKLVVRDFPIHQFQPQETWATPAGHTMYLYLI